MAAKKRKKAGKKGGGVIVLIAGGPNDSFSDIVALMGTLFEPPPKVENFETAFQVPSVKIKKRRRRKNKRK